MVSSNMDTNNNLVSFIIAGTISSMFQGIINKIIIGGTYILKYLLVDWISLTNTDDNGAMICKWLYYYFNNMMKINKLYTSHTTFETAMSINKMWYDPTPNKDHIQIRNIPLGWCYLHNDKYSIILYIDYSNETKCTYGGNFSYSTVVKINVTMYKFFPFWYGKDFLFNFINYTKHMYNKRVNMNQQIYKIDTNRSEWRNPILTNRLKLDEGVFILTSQMKKITDGIRNFLQPSTYDMYKRKGFPYCRKILAYGPPGSGKSQLIVRIAGEFDLPIYFLTPHEQIEKLFDSVQSGIIVIEEIDKRIKAPLNDTNNEKQKRIEEDRLVLLHRLLDRIIGERVIVYMTTNNIEMGAYAI